MVLVQKKNVFFIGATNRPDILDDALLRPGRLDQHIYIPLPDKPSRLSIMKANLRKTPVASDVDMNFISQITEGFSGADLEAICQRASRSAIRENIEANAKLKAAMELDPSLANNLNQDPVPELTRKHFEEALKSATKNVDVALLERYEAFRRKFDPEYAKGGGAGVNINWPTAGNDQGQNNNSIFQNYDANDDDLYS